MKVYIPLIIAVLFSNFHLNSQSLDWVKSFGGVSGSYNDTGVSMTVDTDGNIYTVGFFSENVDFNSDDTEDYFLSSNGNTDIFIQKLDSDGNFLWTKSYGGINRDEAVSTAISNDGFLYITGVFSDTINFEGENISSSGGKDFFILKLDLLGELQWLKTIGSVQHEIARSLTIDIEGDIIVTGFFGGLVDFDPNESELLLNCENTEDVFVLKIDSNGDLIWAKNYGDTERNDGKSVVTDLYGNIYISGAFSVLSEYIVINNGDTISNDYYSEQSMVLKLDAEGNVDWMNTSISAPIIGEIPGDSNGNDINIDSQGNIYVIGSFEKSIQFVESGDVFYNSGVKDVFIEKLDQNGNLLWVYDFNGNENSFNLGTSILVDANDNIIVSGVVNGEFDFGSGILNGIFDAFIQKIDGNGNLIWYKTYTSNSLNICFDIFQDNVGNIYSTGSFGGTINFDSNENPVYQTSVDEADIFILKMNDDDFVSVKEIEMYAASIYPNPTNGLITIEILESFLKTNSLTIVVSDFSGKTVYKKQCYKLNKSYLDLNYLSNGIYILSVINEDNIVYREKLIIQD